MTISAAVLLCIVHIRPFSLIGHCVAEGITHILGQLTTVLVNQRVRLKLSGSTGNCADLIKRLFKNCADKKKNNIENLIDISFMHGDVCMLLRGSSNIFLSSGHPGLWNGYARPDECLPSGVLRLSAVRSQVNLSLGFTLGGFYAVSGTVVVDIKVTASLGFLLHIYSWIFLALSPWK